MSGNGSNYGSEADSDKSSKDSPTLQKVDIIFIYIYIYIFIL